MRSTTWTATSRSHFLEGQVPYDQWPGLFPGQHADVLFGKAPDPMGPFSGSGEPAHPRPQPTPLQPMGRIAAFSVEEVGLPRQTA